MKSHAATRSSCRRMTFGAWLVVSAVAGMPAANAQSDVMQADARSGAQSVEQALQPIAISRESRSTATKPFAFGQGLPFRQFPDCTFPGLSLPADAKILAVQGNGLKQDFQIDQSGNMAVRVDVAINEPAAPVVLILGSYEPTIWNIGWTPGTRLLAVLAGGYSKQVPNGVPDGVPVRTGGFGSKDACQASYASLERIDALNPVSHQVFGRPIDMLYPVADGKAMVGQPLPAGASLLTAASAKSSEAFRIPEAQWAGPPALERAVRLGYLRPATPSDADAWLSEQSKLPALADIPPMAGGMPKPQLVMIRGYVVLKAYAFPAGLYGSNAASFFVPKGVPLPSGSPGHSAVYDFNTLRCTGAQCIRQ